MSDQDNHYAHQREAIEHLVIEEDWHHLEHCLAAALSDAKLPRYHRAKFELFFASCIGDLEVHLDRAKTIIDQIRAHEHNSGWTMEEIDVRLKSLSDMAKDLERYLLLSKKYVSFLECGSLSQRLLGLRDVGIRIAA